MYMLTCTSGAYAQKKSGLAMGTDLRLGYSDKLFTADLGYDLGYKWKNIIYLGVGPDVAISTGSGTTSFLGGGYGKLRFTIPIKTDIKPFLEGRAGYMYNFKTEDGEMNYGAGVGVKFKKMTIGVFAKIQRLTTETKTTYTYQVPRLRRRVLNGKSTTYTDYEWKSGIRIDKDVEWKITPQFLIGFEF